jgi:transcriptional regulator with XRE-family HTH domain
MNIEDQSSLIPHADANTILRQQIISNLSSSKEYRHSFVDEAIRSGLAAQIRAMRGDRTQIEFAKDIGKTQSWVTRLEDPNAPLPTIPTLLGIAEALDINLEVRFSSFSELVERLLFMGNDSFNIPSFHSDTGLAMVSPTPFSTVSLSILGKPKTANVIAFPKNRDARILTNNIEASGLVLKGAS